MTDERFLGENVSPDPSYAAEEGTPGEACCLCGDQIMGGQVAQQRFETDASGRLYRAHAKCAHEYAIAMRAFRSAAEGVTPAF